MSGPWARPIAYKADVAEDEKLPMRARVAVIVGTIVLLWSGIIAAVRALVPFLG
jgi:hypothetical protein